MTDIVSEVARNLRRDNPMYNEFLFDKTKDFLKELYADERMAPKGAHAMRSRLLFAAGQGFLTGYGAGIDGEYDKENTKISSAVADEPWWREVIRSLGDMEVRPFVLARTSRFATASAAIGNPDAFAYYASYGFAVGMERGVTGLSTGEVDYIADDSEERERLGEAFRHEARRAADKVMFLDALRTDTALGWFNDADEDEWDAEGVVAEGVDGEEAPILYDDEGWEVSTAEYGEFGELMRTVASAATEYVLPISTARSGWHPADGKVVRKRMMTYVTYYVDGYCDQAFGCVPDEADLDAYAQDTDSMRKEFARPFGTDYSIDQDVASGRLPSGDASLAKAATRHILDDILDELSETAPLPMLHQAKSLSDLPIPDADDAFWRIASVAYAHGVRKSEEEGREVSEEGRTFFSYASASVEYDEFDDEPDEYDDGYGDFDVFGGEVDPDTILPPGAIPISLADGGTMAEQFAHIGSMNGDDVNSWVAGLRILELKITLAPIEDVDAFEEELLELDEAIRERRRIMPELNEAIREKWGEEGPHVCRLADAIRERRAEG